MSLENPERLFNNDQYKKFTLTWLDKVKAWIFIEEDHPCQTWR